MRSQAFGGIWLSPRSILISERDARRGLRRRRTLPAGRWSRALFEKIVNQTIAIAITFPICIYDGRIILASLSGRPAQE